MRQVYETCVSLTREPHKWAKHMSPTNGEPICGAHVSVRHMSHTPKAYESLSTK